jgi:Meiotically up-regulated gene 113/KilA-N domain
MINITEIAKTYNKRIDNWQRLKSTESLIRRHPGSVKAFQGGEFGNGSTFATLEIAQEFEKWCQKESLESPTQVYLVWAVGSNMFKIGMTSCLLARVKNMQIGSPLRLTVTRAYLCDNPRLLEKKLHETFNPYFSHGEWFEIEADKACKLFDQTILKWTTSHI